MLVLHSTSPRHLPERFIHFATCRSGHGGEAGYRRGDRSEEDDAADGNERFGSGPAREDNPHDEFRIEYPLFGPYPPGMSITVTIDEDLLSAAECATRIHDHARLIEEGLRSLCRGTLSATFDFDATLRAAESLPDLDESEFECLRREINRSLPASW